VHRHYPSSDVQHLPADSQHTRHVPRRRRHCSAGVVVFAVTCQRLSCSIVASAVQDGPSPCRSCSFMRWASMSAEVTRSRGHEADVNGLRLHAIRLPRCSGVQYTSTQEAPRNARPRRTTRVRRSTLTGSGEYERTINRPLDANLSLVLETRPSRTAKWPEETLSSLYDTSRTAS